MRRARGGRLRVRLTWADDRSRTAPRRDRVRGRTRQHRKPGPPPKVFAFVSRVDGAEIARLKQVGLRIDVIAPNWYSLDLGSGALATPLRANADALLVGGARAGRAGLADGQRAHRRRAHLGAPAAVRTQIAGSLRAAALSPGVTGVTLDMEELRADQRGGSARSCGEAAAACTRSTASSPSTCRGPARWRAPHTTGRRSRATPTCCSPPATTNTGRAGRPGPVTTARGFDDIVERALDAAGRRKAVPSSAPSATAGRRAGGAADLDERCGGAPAGRPRPREKPTPSSTTRAPACAPARARHAPAVPAGSACSRSVGSPRDSGAACRPRAAALVSRFVSSVAGCGMHGRVWRSPPSTLVPGVLGCLAAGARRDQAPADGLRTSESGH